MKKEVIIAIIIGFIIGLIITYGIYRAQLAYQGNPTTESQQTSPQDDQSAPSHGLNVTSPIDETVISSESVTISGATTANSYITAVTADSEEFTQADSSGNFSLTYELQAGANLISLTTISPQGETATTDLTLIYSTADLDGQAPSDQGETDDQ